VLVLVGRDVMGELLAAWRKLLRRVLPKLTDPIRESPVLDATLSDPVASVFGYYEGGRLMYAARTCNGFTRPMRVAGASD
jgi:hypothetical protein